MSGIAPTDSRARRARTASAAAHNFELTTLAARAAVRSYTTHPTTPGAAGAARRPGRGAMRDARCQGTAEELSLAVGVMSRPGNADQREAVRRGWGHDDPAVLACFVIGVLLKRTPVNPWAPERKKLLDSSQAVPPRGQLSPLPELDALTQERQSMGDVLLLNGSAEIDSGGTSGLKTLTWWRHAVTHLPRAKWLAKADDDTLLNLPRLFERMPESPSPLALLGTIKFACYSARRFKHERSAPQLRCGRSQFAQARHPGEPAGLGSTYEGPYAFALGWFYAIPRPLAVRLAECPYAQWFHSSALAATSEPFFRKEDDPMNGHWLHKCLNATGERVHPLPSLGPRLASNMACISRSGLYRRPHNASVLVHFLKTPQSMEYALGLLKRLRRGDGLLPTDRECCTRSVWPKSAGARKLPPSVCDGL